jgi:hypothetical protein
MGAVASPSHHSRDPTSHFRAGCLLSIRRRLPGRSSGCTQRRHSPTPGSVLCPPFAADLDRLDSAWQLSLAAWSTRCPARIAPPRDSTSPREPGRRCDRLWLVGRIVHDVRRCPDARRMYGTPRLSEPHQQYDPFFGGLPILTGLPSKTRHPPGTIDMRHPDIVRYSLMHASPARADGGNNRPKHEYQ